jgi:hypothetical protein
MSLRVYPWRPAGRQENLRVLRPMTDGARESVRQVAHSVNRGWSWPEP